MTKSSKKDKLLLVKPGESLNALIERLRFPEGLSEKDFNIPLPWQLTGIVGRKPCKLAVYGKSCSEHRSPLHSLVIGVVVLAIILACLNIFDAYRSNDTWTLIKQSIYAFGLLWAWAYIHQLRKWAHHSEDHQFILRMARKNEPHQVLEDYLCEKRLKVQSKILSDVGEFSPIFVRMTEIRNRLHKLQDSGIEEAEEEFSNSSPQSYREAAKIESKQTRMQRVRTRLKTQLTEVEEQIAATRADLDWCEKESERAMKLMQELPLMKEAAEMDENIQSDIAEQEADILGRVRAIEERLNSAQNSVAEFLDRAGKKVQVSKRREARQKRLRIKSAAPPETLTEQFREMEAQAEADAAAAEEAEAESHTRA